jgi:PmbA protein
MNKELKTLAAWSIETAKSSGADACRVSIDGSRVVEISYRERKPENIKEASKKNLSIDIFVKGRYSNQSTSDLRKEPLKKFISNAVETTKLLAEDPYRSLPDPKYFENMSKQDLKILDPDYQKLTPEKRHEIVKSIENAALIAGGDKVISVTAESEDGHEETILMTSNGFEGYEEDTYYVFGGNMTIQDEGDRRPRNYFYVVTTNQTDIPTPEKIGQEITSRTMDLMGGKKLKTETLPVIIENRVAPRLMGGFVQAMSGRNVQQKQSFLAGKKDQKIGSNLFTLIDDPFVPGGLGSALFDSDGMATKKRIMVDKGVLKEYYVDWYYSRKLGWEPTTARNTNLIIPPGKRSIKEIMKDLDRGIFINGFIGGNSNSTTGDTSVGIMGKLFENGEFTQTVAEMNIADNYLNFWHKLAEVANDPWIFSRYRVPSLVFTDVVVSGA